MWRVVVPTAATAGLSTALAVAINVATGGGHSVWAWVAVAVLTVGVFVVSLWLHHNQSSAVPAAPAPEPALGIDLSDLQTPGGMSAEGVHSTGTAVKIDKGRFGGGLVFKNIRAGHGDVPPHP